MKNRTLKIIMGINLETDSDYCIKNIEEIGLKYDNEAYFGTFEYIIDFTKNDYNRVLITIKQKLEQIFYHINASRSMTHELINFFEDIEKKINKFFLYDHINFQNNFTKPAEIQSTMNGNYEGTVISLQIIPGQKNDNIMTNKENLQKVFIVMEYDKNNVNLLKIFNKFDVAQQYKNNYLQSVKPIEFKHVFIIEKEVYSDNE